MSYPLVVWETFLCFLSHLEKWAFSNTAFFFSFSRIDVGFFSSEFKIAVSISFFFSNWRFFLHKFWFFAFCSRFFLFLFLSDRFTKPDVFFLVFLVVFLVFLFSGVYLYFSATCSYFAGSFFNVFCYGQFFKNYRFYFFCIFLGVFLVALVALCKNWRIPFIAFFLVFQKFVLVFFLSRI